MEEGRGDREERFNKDKVTGRVDEEQKEKSEGWVKLLAGCGA